MNTEKIKEYLEQIIRHAKDNEPYQVEELVNIVLAELTAEQKLVSCDDCISQSIYEGKKICMLPEKFCVLESGVCVNFKPKENMPVCPDCQKQEAETEDNKYLLWNLASIEAAENNTNFQQTVARQAKNVIENQQDIIDRQAKEIEIVKSEAKLWKLRTDEAAKMVEVQQQQNEKLKTALQNYCSDCIYKYKVNPNE